MTWFIHNRVQQGSMSRVKTIKRWFLSRSMIKIDKKYETKMKEVTNIGITFFKNLIWSYAIISVSLLSVDSYYYSACVFNT